VSRVRREVAEVYRDLGRLGLNTGSTGNVSARTRGGMVITQTGGTAQTVDADSLAAMALDGTVRGNAVPSSEWAMHAAIYLADPAAKAIVHTHADACTALACLNEGLPAFHYMIASFGGEDVRCAPYVTFGTPELAVLATEALVGRSACLLANHGMIVHAASPRQALLAALRLETLCRQYLLARAAGTPRLLTPAEMAAAMVRFESYAAGKG
jgi:L-fuculose-phosphate aldolase